MRPAAEIDEFAGGIERHHRLGDFFFDQLALENLIGFFVELKRFGLGHVLAFVLQVLRGKLVHFLFDFAEVFGRERLFAQKFVEEAVFHGRPDAEFDVGIQLHHGGGKQVRGGVAEYEQRVGVFVGEDS
jgi:hypothetical protein